MALLRAGDHVVSSRALFGSCLYILEEVLTRFGVEVTFVDGTDLDQWRAAVRPGTKAVFLESISNPTLEVIDLKSVSDLPMPWAPRLSSTTSLPRRSFPMRRDRGADVVVYSTTKHVDGQGRCLGGVVWARRTSSARRWNPISSTRAAR